MIIAGIDPSLGRTAIAVGTLAGAQVTAIESQAEGRPLYERFDRYRMILAKTLRLIADADIVMIEAYSFASKGNSAVSLGEYGGVLRHEMLRRQLRVIEVPPTSLKLFVTGKGNASKPFFIGTAVNKWGEVFPGEDEYFAFALYKLGLVFTNQMEPENAHQSKALLVLR